MNAVSHAATALVLKKRFDHLPIWWLLLSVQAMEFLWLVFNWIGIEHVTTESQVRSIADIHLHHMPYSHSVLAAAMIAGICWLALSQLTTRRQAGLAVALGVISHLVLDILTHAPDMPLAWFGSETKLGTGLYGNAPLVALAVEVLYGLGCWLYFRGDWRLLTSIVVFNASSLSFYSPDVVGLERLIADHTWLMPVAVGAQIAATLALVARFSQPERGNSSTLAAPMTSIDPWCPPTLP